MIDQPKQLQRLLHLAGIVCCAGIAVGAYFVGYIPVQRSAQDLIHSRRTARQFSQTQAEIAARNHKIEQQVAQQEGLFKKLQSRIPNRPQEDELLRTYSRLAKASGTQLLGFQPGGIQKHGKLQAAVVRINLSGSYAGICRLMALLESTGRLQRVSQLTLLAADRANGYLNVSLEVHAYFQPKTTQRS